MIVLNAAEANGGWITFSDLRSKHPEFNNRERFANAINQLLQDGLGWEDDESFLDAQSSVGRYTKDPQDQGLVYWFPTLMKDESGGKSQMDQDENLIDLI